MTSDPSPRRRPYWHVDAKWITGILLVFVMGLTLLVYGLVQVTAEEPAVDAMSMAMALALSRNGLDNETEVEEIRQRLRESPDGSIQPIPGLRLVIQEKDIEGLSPRQMRLYFFRQLAEPVYRGGSQGLVDMADDPEMRKSIQEGAGSLGVLSVGTHNILQRVLTILVTASFVLLIPLVLFSHRFGRIGSPGCVLFVAGLPGAVFFTLLGKAPAMTTPPSEQEGMTGLLSYVASNVLPPMAQTIARSYVIVLMLGLGLMLLAVLSNLIWWMAHRKRRSQKAAPAREYSA